MLHYTYTAIFFTKTNKLNWGWKTDSKFPVDAGFLRDKASVTAAVLSDMIRGTMYS